MRRIGTGTCTLLIAISALLLASGAYAAKKQKKPKNLSDLRCSVDEIAKFTGESWVCSADRTDETEYVVVADDGTEIGDVVQFGQPGYANGSALVEVEFLGRPHLAVVGSTSYSDAVALLTGIEPTFTVFLDSSCSQAYAYGDVTATPNCNQFFDAIYSCDDPSWVASLASSTVGPFFKLISTGPELIGYSESGPFYLPGAGGVGCFEVDPEYWDGGRLFPVDYIEAGSFDPGPPPYKIRLK